jgi:hypothetical protein
VNASINFAAVLSAGPLLAVQPSPWRDEAVGRLGAGTLVEPSWVAGCAWPEIVDRAVNSA